LVLVKSIAESRGGPSRHTACHGVGGFLAGLVDPGGVNPEGGDSPAAVAEPAGDGAEVDAGGEQLGGVVVPELVQVVLMPSRRTIRSYRCVTVSGTSGRPQSGSSENR
jgi:hypothetical protein